MTEGRRPRSRSDLVACLIGLVLVAASLSPVAGAAQVEVSAGVLVVPRPSIGGTQVGPLVSAAGLSEAFGVPVFLEMSMARTDFASLGQNYHHNHYHFALGAEWVPTRGATRLAVRLGLGAYGEYEVVEADPSSSGGDSWVETVVFGLVLERDLGDERQLIAGFSDTLLGPWFAVLDPEEYSVEHRLRMMLGVRF